MDDKDFPILKLSIEGFGGTVYIKTEDNEYIAEIGVGKECYAKTSQEAVRIAHKLVQEYCNSILKDKLEDPEEDWETVRRFSS
jgi:hypothetical protein